MRFVTFEYQGHRRAGVLLDMHDEQHMGYLIDGTHPARPEALQSLQPNMMDWIEAGLVKLSRSLRSVTPEPSCLLPLNAVRLVAPLPRPGKIVGAAFNYKDGLAASGRAASSEPVIFIKSHATVIGPDEPIVLAPGNQVTYEAELAVIIGTPALRVPPEKALAHVCGYAIFNDVSYTNFVREDGGFVRGKNQPTTGPLGPWIVSADDIKDPHKLQVELEVDEALLQSSSTANMLFRIEALIAYASSHMPLDAGDIIATGTPAGVAANHTPAAWLKHGQRATLRVESLGELSNHIVEA